MLEPAQAEIDRGADLLTAGNIEEALVAYEAALQLDPDMPTRWRDGAVPGVTGNESSRW